MINSCKICVTRYVEKCQYVLCLHAGNSVKDVLHRPTTPWLSHYTKVHKWNTRNMNLTLPYCTFPKVNILWWHAFSYCLKLMFYFRLFLGSKSNLMFEWKKEGQNSCSNPWGQTTVQTVQQTCHGWLTGVQLTSGFPLLPWVRNVNQITQYSGPVFTKLSIF